MAHRYLVLDLTSSPPCVVLLTDSGKEAEDVAQKYANQTERYCSVFETKARKDCTPNVGAASLTFATREDAIKAGMPDAPIASSDRRDDGRGNRQ